MASLDDVQLMEQIQKWKEPMIESLKEILRIPSILDESSQHPPFGSSIDEALRKILALCDHLGFRTYYDPEGYYGYAEVGVGTELIGVLSHLDVVPAGDLNTWDQHPFDPQIVDGKLYGRGTQDDKGPTMAALFAVKALMETGVDLPKRVRFIFGTDEENHWRCMKKYVQKEEVPIFGFTPDSKFPLIYAEKGLLQVQLQASNTTTLTLEGGTALNSVPDRIVYRGDRQEALVSYLEKLGYDYQVHATGVEVLGKASHAQFTERGINAISRLAIALHDIGIGSRAIQFIAHEIKEDPHATGLFGPVEDAVSGKLNCNIGKIKITEKHEELLIDIRIPVTVDKQEILDKLSQKAQLYGLTLKEREWMPSIYVPKDHVLVRTLMQVYQEVTGDCVSKPIASGGATYARAMKNCVAFGAIFPHREKMAHQSNEYIEVEDLTLSMEIYAKAIYRLTRTTNS